MGYSESEQPFFIGAIGNYPFDKKKKERSRKFVIDKNYKK